MRPGEIVAGIGGAILLVSLFLPWYDDHVRLLAGFGGGRLTGWQSFTVVDILLALAALVALALPLVSATSNGPAKPIGHAVIASVTGAIAVALVVWRLIDEPGEGDLVAVQAGAWLGLAGALVACGGAWLAMRDESTPGATPPDVPCRPAPPPNITADAEP